MASRVSSDPTTPPALPGLGTTWYERGASYWGRRVVTGVLWVGVTGLVCFLAVSLYGGFRDQLPGPVRVVWDWVQAVAACGAFVWGWLVQRRGHRAKLADPPTPQQAWDRKSSEKRRTTGLAVLGRVLAVVAAPVAPAIAAFALGWVCAVVTVREYPSEAGARRALGG
ncbi:hypothetical protein [Streptomyces varsoviensis]|uniref:Uncharacterized protein n=1 Tax=Streptomyces varsoviensis TaxID=67373 RepID=A0ABR5J0L5_9ACTN|nr:hypothetical protein [Streptomyces varsoviensis]KOG86931.1 hypothetical protein ADK38_28255 [Streptomyces varsoviensis]